MGTTLTLTQDKLLMLKQKSSNYKNENNYETLTINLPTTYQDKRTDDYMIQLNVINADKLGDILVLKDPEIKNGRYVYTTPIPNKWTYKEGDILFWLKFTGTDGTVGLTNSVKAYISDSQDITEYIPEQTLSIIDEMNIEINALKESIEKMTKTINPQILVDDYWVMTGKDEG